MQDDKRNSLLIAENCGIQDPGTKEKPGQKLRILYPPPPRDLKKTESQIVMKWQKYDTHHPSIFTDLPTPYLTPNSYEPNHLDEYPIRDYTRHAVHPHVHLALLEVCKLYFNMRLGYWQVTLDLYRAQKEMEIRWF